MRFETIAIHAGKRPDTTFGAISAPIYPALSAGGRRVTGWFREMDCGGVQLRRRI